MRRLLLLLAVTATALTVGLTGTAVGASAPMQPYNIAPTWQCLVRQGLHVSHPLHPSSFPAKVLQQLIWRVGNNRDIYIGFAANPTRAAELRRQLWNTSRAFGAPASALRIDLLRTGNVVYCTNYFTGRIRSRLALVWSCLR
jgi:hypothetical protein